nr:hypothetical protein K-LCC10_0444 [Kaumoebavirus]
MTNESQILNKDAFEKFIQENPTILYAGSVNGKPDWDAIFDHVRANPTEKYVLYQSYKHFYLLPWNIALNFCKCGDKVWAELWKKHKGNAPTQLLFDFQVTIAQELNVVWYDTINRSFNVFNEACERNKMYAPESDLGVLFKYTTLKLAFKSLLDGMGAPTNFEELLKK